MFPKFSLLRNCHYITIIPTDRGITLMRKTYYLYSKQEENPSPIWVFFLNFLKERLK
jgi:hypothetical protein